VRVAYTFLPAIDNNIPKDKIVVVSSGPVIPADPQFFLDGLILYTWANYSPTLQKAVI